MLEKTHRQAIVAAAKAAGVPPDKIATMVAIAEDRVPASQEFKPLLVNQATAARMLSVIGRVEVDIVRSGQQITTGQVTITFLQSEPAGEKSLPRELRAGFYSKTGVPISDAKVLKFDSTAEDARQRERGEQFVFGREADQFNQQEVVLRLDEQIAGTTQFAPYREFIFKLRRAFESDFDEF